MALRLAVFDYGSGNLASAAKALSYAGNRFDAVVEVTDQVGVAERADGLLVPGVGAYGSCMRGLRAVGGVELIAARVASGRAVLGVCVGMQVMFAYGNEHGVTSTGCGQWPGTVERLRSRAPIPHIGWNTVSAPANSAMFESLGGQRFYFVHSYADRCWQGGPATATVTWCEYGGDRFVAAVEDGALCATQFHPEKSGTAGLRLLANWVAGVAG